MIRDNRNLGRILSLAAVALMAVAWGAPRAAQAGTWPEAKLRAPSPPSSQRIYFETSGYRVPVENFPIHMVHLGAPPAGMTQAQVDAAARNATQSWSQTPCSFARIDYAGPRESVDDLGPGEVPFQFVEPGGAGCLPGDSIGWTALSCGPDYPTNSVFLNRRDYHWSEKAHPFEHAGDDTTSFKLTVELQSVLTHEFGHVLGLMHSEDSLATMAPTYRADGGQRSLAVDDKLGVCALYPAVNPPDECQSGRDCQAQESCEHVRLQTIDGAEGEQCIALCRELRGEVGDACAPDRLICVEGCVFAAEAKSFGYCTVGCEAGDCPADYECREDLLRPGEAHCLQLRKIENPGCSAAPDALPSPFTVWLCAVAGVLWLRVRWLRVRWLRARRFNRPSKTR